VLTGILPFSVLYAGGLDMEVFACVFTTIFITFTFINYRCRIKRACNIITPAQSLYMIYAGLLIIITEIFTEENLIFKQFDP
jgi:hypothetical protein